MFKKVWHWHYVSWQVVICVLTVVLSIFYNAVKENQLMLKGIVSNLTINNT
jgi:hypothetical protein